MLVPIRLALIVFAIFLGSVAFAESESPTEATTITPSELQVRLDSGAAPAVIDVRSAEEYAAGHIPGAVNIPFAQVADRISEVDTSHGVALYCMVGPRARKGEAALLASGYTSVLHIDGGLAAWQQAGYAIEVGE
jgi:rhodanese-related sulfurtransferase